jgi:acyl-CoA thioester hydrolase
MSQPRVVESTVRVRYAETDAEGVVYYANHFVYMEVGRINFLRALGIDRAFWQRAGRGLLIVEASCKYRAAAHFDDVLAIRTCLEEVRRSSFSMRYEILDQQSGGLVAEGRTVQVFADLKTLRAIRLPTEAYDLLTSAARPRQNAAALPESTGNDAVGAAQVEV